MQDFHQLRVWQGAHEFALAVKRAARSFPRVGQSESKSQLIRAADSIVSNIVEGCGAATRKEFARYLDISIKSACEVEYRLQLAYDENCMSYRVWQRLSEQVIRIRKMLFRLRKSVIAADEAEQKRRRASRKPTKNDRQPRTQDPQPTTR
jgi:four helix bundle protein